MTPSSDPSRPSMVRLAEEDEEHAARTGADGAQDSDFGAAADHAHGDGVVDEKCADEERNVTQYSQIPAKCAEHASVFLAARAWRFDGVGGGHDRFDELFRLVGALAGAEEDFNAVDLAIHVEQLLCGGDVDADPAGVLIRRYRLNAEGFLEIAAFEREDLAFEPVKARGEVAGDGQGGFEG